MTHAELVENVARAIEEGELHAVPHDQLYPTMARAAIAAIHSALQEPTWMNDGDYVGHTPRQAWRTMIDASPLKP